MSGSTKEDVITIIAFTKGNLQMWQSLVTIKSQFYHLRMNLSLIFDQSRSFFVRNSCFMENMGTL